MSTTYTCTMQLECRKKHTCCGCGCVYSYVLKRSVTGQGGTEWHAREQARASYRDSMRTAVDVKPCPECGSLQPEMVGQWRFLAHVWVIAGMLGLFLLFVVAPNLLFGDRWPDHVYYAFWVPVAFSTAIAVALAWVEFHDPVGNGRRNRTKSAAEVASGIMRVHQPGRGVGPATVPAGMLRRIFVPVAFIAPLYAAAVWNGFDFGPNWPTPEPPGLLLITDIMLLVPAVALILAARHLRNKGGTNEVISEGGETLDPATFSLEPMQAMETRLRAETVGDERRFEIRRIEARGLFPVTRQTRLGFMSSIVDVTDADVDGSGARPVLSTLEDFQESDTICYRDRTEIGEVEKDYGWRDWTGVLTIIPETLVPPRKGPRHFRVQVFAFDQANEPVVRTGFWVENHPLAHWAHDFEWTVTSDGYEEQSEKREQAEELIVRLAVAMAFTDDTFHENEGEVVKNWILRRLDPLGEETRERRKRRLNAAFREAFTAGEAGRSGAAGIMDSLREIGDENLSLEAVELCLDVMSADNKTDETELRVVREVGRRLGVDVDRFRTLLDKHLIGRGELEQGIDFHQILHIDPAWGPEEVRSHLIREYSKWNSRAESLTDPEQRAQAEKMLEIVAAARKALSA